MMCHDQSVDLMPLRTRPEDSRAVSAVLSLTRAAREASDHTHLADALNVALIEFAMLVRMLPPDSRMRLIDQVLIIFDPDLASDTSMMSAVRLWDGLDPNRLLDELAVLAGQRGAEICGRRPERAVAYRNYCHRTQAPMLLQLAA